jgi:hypothetical protein
MQSMSLTATPFDLPALAESQHPLVVPLASYTDQELLQQWQQAPEQGKYFTALFCRYGHLVYALLRHQAKSLLQVDYLFAKTWQLVFNGLTNLKVTEKIAADSPTSSSLQTWILSQTAGCIHREEVPAIANIHYSLSAAPPPLWCYLEAALGQMPDSTRLMILMARTFHWSESRIAAYLQSEGEDFSVADVQTRLTEGYRLLSTLIPDDIQTIYLESPGLEWSPSLAP